MKLKAYYARQDDDEGNTLASSYFFSYKEAEEWSRRQRPNTQVDVFRFSEGEWEWVSSELHIHFPGAGS